MNDLLDRLIAYKDKLDSGQELTEEEQAQLEVDLKELAALFSAFVEALREAFIPVITHLAETLKKLWEALPEGYREAIQADMAPRVEFKLGDVVTPYNPNSQRVTQAPSGKPLIDGVRPAADSQFMRGTSRPRGMMS